MFTLQRLNAVTIAALAQDDAATATTMMDYAFEILQKHPGAISVEQRTELYALATAYSYIYDQGSDIQRFYRLLTQRRIQVAGERPENHPMVRRIITLNEGYEPHPIQAYFHHWALKLDDMYTEMIRTYMHFVIRRDQRE